MQDADHVIRTAPPLPPIQLGSRGTDARQARANLLFLLFTRLLALVWLGEGMLHWAALLSDPEGVFTTMSMQRMAAVFFFCVMDFVAAVGLWLTAPWGGVVWLVIVGAQVLSWLILPGFWTRGTVIIATDAVLVPVYLGLAWNAGRMDQRNG